MNIHSPARLNGETLASYRGRLQLSRAIAKAASIGESPAAFVQRGRQQNKQPSRNCGQNPKPLIERQRKPKPAVAATWPKSLDQKRQSRPVHVLHPNREPDASKREKPKSAVAKRMDRPSRSALMEAGHAKLMRWFGA